MTQIDYNEKVVCFNPDGTQTKVDKYKHRPGDVVFVSTIPKILKAIVVGVSYPEGYDYNWDLQVDDGTIRVLGESLHKSYDEAYNALCEGIRKDIERYERRVIVWKADLMRLAEDKEEFDKAEKDVILQT